MYRLMSLLLSLLVSMPAISAANVSVSIDKQNVVPGEQVNLEFIATTDQYFVDSPEFSVPYVADAMVKQEQTSVLSGFSYVDGKKYTSQRWSIQVYPNNEGVYLIPSIDVTLLTAGDGGNSVKTHHKTQPMAIMVNAPATMKGKSGYLVSPAVTVTDKWSPNVGQNEQFKKGDIIQRTVTIKADDTSTFMMPDFIPLIPNGISISISEPQLSSNYTRGEHYSTLTQKVSYSIDEPGHYSLGGEALFWWNPSQKVKQSWTAKHYSIDSGGFDYKQLTKWLIGLFGALTASVGGVICAKTNSKRTLRLKRLFFGQNATWINSCYSKASDKSFMLLIDASSDDQVLKDVLKEQFMREKPVGKWQRFKAYMTL